MRYLIVLILMLAALAVFASVAGAQPTCQAWTWDWFKDWGSGDYYYQYYQWCQVAGQGWFREWGGWGWA